MIVENQLDGGLGGISRIQPLEKTDELARAMAILDAGVDMAGQQVDARQQAQCTSGTFLSLLSRLPPARFWRRVENTEFYSF